MESKTFFNVPKDFTVGEKNYKISEMTLGDLAAFEEYADEYKKKRLVATYKLCETKVDVSKIIDVTANEQERNAMMSQIHGMIFLVHRILNKHQVVPMEDIQQIPMEKLSEMLKIIFPAVAEDTSKN